MSGRRAGRSLKISRARKTNRTQPRESISHPIPKRKSETRQQRGYTPLIRDEDVDGPRGEGKKKSSVKNFFRASYEYVSHLR